MLAEGAFGIGVEGGGSWLCGGRKEGAEGTLKCTNLEDEKLEI